MAAKDGGVSVTIAHTVGSDPPRVHFPSAAGLRPVGGVSDTAAGGQRKGTWVEKLPGKEPLTMASWSDWVPLSNADVPRSPGVYLARQGAVGPVVYVGMAGQRSGQGLRGRFRRYTSGKALASGLGEAVFDRALADVAWLRQRLAEVETGRPMRATDWGKAALAWADLHVCWAVTETSEAAEALEKKVLALETVDWWNRGR